MVGPSLWTNISILASYMGWLMSLICEVFWRQRFLCDLKSPKQMLSINISSNASSFCSIDSNNKTVFSLTAWIHQGWDLITSHQNGFDAELWSVHTADLPDVCVSCRLADSNRNTLADEVSLAPPPSTPSNNQVCPQLQLKTLLLYKVLSDFPSVWILIDLTPHLPLRHCHISYFSSLFAFYQGNVSVHWESRQRQNLH